MNPSITIDRNAMEAGGGLVVKNRRGKMVRWGLYMAIALSVAAVCAMRSGDDAVFRIGSEDYSRLLKSVIKAVVFLAAVSGLTFFFYALDQRKEAAYVKRILAEWMAKTDGLVTLEFCDLGLKYTTAHEVTVLQDIRIQEVVPGEHYTLVIVEDSARKKEIFLPIKKERQDLLNLLMAQNYSGAA